jgi:hypothetical protein
MKTASTCRRKHTRHRIPEGVAGTVVFGYPKRTGARMKNKIKDISSSGLSFVLATDLPGLDFGAMLQAAEVRVGRRRLTADLLVMHLTPDAKAGATCGVLVYPEQEEGIVTFHAILAELRVESAEPKLERILPS